MNISQEICLFDFNNNLDLLYICNRDSRNNYFNNKYNYYNNYNKDFCIISFPDYSEQKFYRFNYEVTKIQFMENNLFFVFQYSNLSLFKINKEEISLVNSLDKIELDKDNSSIICLNNNFYAVNNGKDFIYIINKRDLTLSKSIYIKSGNLTTNLFKVNDNLITIFFIDKYNGKIKYQNYEILLEGIKWVFKKEKLMELSNIKDLQLDIKSILLIGDSNSYLIESEFDKKRFYFYILLTISLISFLLFIIFFPKEYYKYFWSAFLLIALLINNIFMINE